MSDTKRHNNNYINNHPNHNYDRLNITISLETVDQSWEVAAAFHVGNCRSSCRNSAAHLLRCDVQPSSL